MEARGLLRLERMATGVTGSGLPGATAASGSLVRATHRASSQKNERNFRKTRMTSESLLQKQERQTVKKL